MTRTLPLRAPVDGVVTERTAVAGMRFAPGDTLFRIADLSQMWFIADVFEQDLASVRIGAAAKVTVGAYPDRTFAGTVAFIYPSVARETRTAKVRIELPNPGRISQGGHVWPSRNWRSSECGAGPGRAGSAVISGGTTQTVLIEKGEGRYQPRKVKLGQQGDGYVEVREGIATGEKVVTGANFLIDAESNLRAALQSFTQGKEGTP